MVDFSCGANEWVPIVQARCRSQGFEVVGRSYDIIIARNLSGFVLKSWLDTRAGEGELHMHERHECGRALLAENCRGTALSLSGGAKSYFESRNCFILTLAEGMAHPNHLVIGLNPPFGKNNSLAEQWVQHGAKQFSPRILVSAVPCWRHRGCCSVPNETTQTEKRSTVEWNGLRI